MSQYFMKCISYEYLVLVLYLKQAYLFFLSVILGGEISTITPTIDQPLISNPRRSKILKVLGISLALFKLEHIMILLIIKLLSVNMNLAIATVKKDPKRGATLRK